MCHTTDRQFSRHMLGIRWRGAVVAHEPLFVVSGAVMTRQPGTRGVDLQSMCLHDRCVRACDLA